MASTFERLEVHTIGTDFRACTHVVKVPFDGPESPVKEGFVRVRVYYAGVNASDVNFAAGRYQPGVQPPFAAGFEVVGKIVAVGANVKLAVGTPVVVTQFGGYSEYIEVKAEIAIPVPAAVAAVLPLPVSGLTASVALKETAELRSNETVLVTAAAGGTGQFAVQLAKIAGNHVIGTCSSDDKVEFLKKIGCDRVINYKKESIDEVLKKEYPKGVDVVYESVGGETYNTCVNNLAIKGRLVVIGAVSGYLDGHAFNEKQQATETPLALKLLRKSASVRGFFLAHYTADFPAHMGQLMSLIQQGKLIPGVDPTEFRGLQSVPDAVDHMYSGKNIGKVVVTVYDGKESQ